MSEDAPKNPKPANERELELIDMLRGNPALMNHVEELARMARDPKELGKSGHEAERSVIDLIGKCGLQSWASSANERSERETERSRPKGHHLHVFQARLKLPEGLVEAGKRQRDGRAASRQGQREMGNAMELPKGALGPITLKRTLR